MSYLGLQVSNVWYSGETARLGGVPRRTFCPTLHLQPDTLCQVDKCRRMGANVILFGAHIGEQRGRQAGRNRGRKRGIEREREG